VRFGLSAVDIIMLSVLKSGTCSMYGRIWAPQPHPFVRTADDAATRLPGGRTRCFS